MRFGGESIRVSSARIYFEDAYTRGYVFGAAAAAAANQLVRVSSNCIIMRRGGGVCGLGWLRKRVDATLVGINCFNFGVEKAPPPPVCKAAIKIGRFFWYRGVEVGYVHL